MPDTRGTKCDTCVNNMFNQESQQQICEMHQLEFASPDAYKCDWYDSGDPSLENDEKDMKIPCYDCFNNWNGKCTLAKPFYKSRKAKNCTSFRVDTTKNKTNVIGFPALLDSNKKENEKPKVKSVSNNEISVLMYLD